MCKTLSFSVYISSFETQKEILQKVKGQNAFVFSSFHRAEEINESYVKKATEMCKWLKENGFKLIGDVSCRTPKLFGCKNILEFAQKLHIAILRLDYGFTQEETIEIGEEIPIAINASTNNLDSFENAKQHKLKIFGIHNFYPRPETGLDEEIFKAINQNLLSLEIEPMAFIPCDKVKRGPIYEGLPTLELHRNIPPYCSFVDLAENYGINNIIAGDICMSDRQLELIYDYIATGVISLPMVIDEKYSSEYGKTYTMRIDSPSCAFRLVESREYSHPGDLIEPYHCRERITGCLTLDNIGYNRYSGEMMIIRKTLPLDEKVNVIGYVQKEYESLLSAIHVGNKVKFIMPI